MKKRICTMILGTMFAVSGLISADDSTNLLKNSDLKFDSKGQLIDWSGSNKFIQDTGYKSQNSIHMTVEKQARSCFQLTMMQNVKELKPGKYIFSAYIKLDRKIRELLLCRIIKLDGKDDYQVTKLKEAEQPEPGVWVKVIAEFDIPEGTTSSLIAFDLRDALPGATVWVDSPVLTYKLE